MDGARVGGDPVEVLLPSDSIDAIILNVDFRLLTKKIQSLLFGAYLNHKPLRDCYSGTTPPDDITKNLTLDIISLSCFAVCALYNRLRTIAQSYCPAAVVNRMNRFLPVSRDIKFPTFLSNLLSSIGALRISTGSSSPPRYLHIVYAPPHSEHSLLFSHIRKSPDVAIIHPGRYNRLIKYLGRCGIDLAPLDYKRLDGTLWTTCHLSSEDGEGGRLLNVYGTVPRTRYLNEDIVRSMAILDPEPGSNPFEGITELTVRFSNNRVVLVDDDVPTINASSSQEHGRLTYNVNTFRFEPANPGVANIVGSGAGNNNTVYSCILARRATRGKIRTVLRRRLLAHAPQ